MSEEITKYNGYDLSNIWFEFCLDNPDLVKPMHTALYFWIVHTFNKFQWKSKVGLPTDYAMEVLGIKSYNTYSKTLNDIIEFGFIEMIEKSKNQYSSNIIALSIFDKAPFKAQAKATIKHELKQSESTEQSIDSIIKLTKHTKHINEQNSFKKETDFSKNEIFGNEVLEDQIWLEAISMQNKIPTEKISDWILEFNKKLILEYDSKTNKQDYAGHFSRWLPQEISKVEKTISENGSNGKFINTTGKNTNSGYQPAKVDREELLRELASDVENGNIPGDYSKRRLRYES